MVDVNQDGKIQFEGTMLFCIDWQINFSLQAIATTLLTHGNLQSFAPLSRLLKISFSFSSVR